MNESIEPMECLRLQQALNRARQKERELSYEFSVLNLARGSADFHRLPEHAKDRLEEDQDEWAWLVEVAQVDVQALSARLAKMAGGHGPARLSRLG